MYSNLRSNGFGVHCVYGEPIYSGGQLHTAL